MKHGKGEKAMSEEEVLEALEVIREALMRTARCFFSCYADCEDAVQECFYKAWRGRESIQNPEYFKTWATRILVNECKTCLFLWKLMIVQSTMKANMRILLNLIRFTRQWRE